MLTVNTASSLSSLLLLTGVILVIIFAVILVAVIVRMRTKEESSTKSEEIESFCRPDETTKHKNKNSVGVKPVTKLAKHTKAVKEWYV